MTNQAYLPASGDTKTNLSARSTDGVRAGSFWKKSRATLLSAMVLTVAYGVAGFMQQADAATIKVAYASDYLFTKPELIAQYYNNIKGEFEAKHPGDKLELIPIPGSYDDFTTKLSLLFNSSSTAPDVVHYMSESVGQFAGGELLMPIDDMVKSEEWWKSFPEPVQAIGKADSKQYGVSVGLNTYALLYDRTVLKKAALPTDWSPKNWKDILDAGRAIKKSQPDSWPIWLVTGTAQGASAIANGPGLMVTASSDPTIFDEKTKKWVVDSKGIREVLEFYRQASAEGLLAPSSQIMDANALNNSSMVLPKRNTGIVFAGDWIPVNWQPKTCAPCWAADEQKTIGFAKVPTSQGQPPHVVTMMDSQTVSLYKNTAHKDLAWSLVNIMEEKKQLLDLATWGPAIPPVPAYVEDPAYMGLSRPEFQKGFAELTSVAAAVPSNAELAVWAFAIQQATQNLVLNPKMSIDDAVAGLNKYVVGQLGTDRVETLK